MNKTLIVIIVVIVIALGAGSVFLRKGTDTVSQNASPTGSSLVAVTTQKGDSDAVSQKSASKQFFQTITIDSQPFFFKPNFFRVKAGVKATVTVDSQGDHTFTIDEFKINVKTANGKKTQFSFTPNKKGMFHYYCATPGHRDAGQQGTLIVE